MKLGDLGVSARVSKIEVISNEPYDFARSCSVVMFLQLGEQGYARFQLEQSAAIELGRQLVALGKDN